jgi:phage FluMu gp28-like protein
VKMLTASEWEKQRQEAMAAMPAVIAEVGLPKVLLPYQARTVSLLDSSCPVLFVEKSRRVGLTWGLAAYAALRAGRQKKAGGMDVMYISYSREMTREFIDACAMWARAFDVAAGEVEETLFDQDDADKAINAFRIKFASGFEIMALSSAPRGLRGKQGVIIIDEAAFVDSLAELLKAALAFLMWGGQVVVCSTHDGVDNEFNAKIQDILAERSKYKHLRIDFDQALNEGLYQRICLVTGREWSAAAEAAWRQDIIDFYGDGADEELFCVPSMSSGSWLPAPLIEARMVVQTPVLRLELPPDYMFRNRVEQASLMAPFLEELRAQLAALDLTPQFAFGFDFARVADLTAGSLMAIEQRLKRREVLAFELRNVPGVEQKLIVRTIFQHLRGRMIGAAFDATGMGWTVAEDLGREFGLREDPEGAGLVIAVKFSEEWYRLNMPPLKAAIEDDKLDLIADAEHLGDLRAVKLVRGIARVPALREGTTGKKRHGDHAIAVALAHWASRMRFTEYGYQAVPQASGLGATMTDYAQDDDFSARDEFRSPLGAGLRGGI